MSDWTIVLWNEARQITSQLDIAKDLWPNENVSPQSHFEFLRQGGHRSEAALLIGAALPKIEMINWVATSLPLPEQTEQDYAGRSQIRAIIQRWIDDPDDDSRRSLFDLAQAGDSTWPETLLALSIYFSGGSIAPENIDAIQPNPMVCVQLGVAALQTASANASQHDPEFMNSALDLANKIAQSGR